MLFLKNLMLKICCIVVLFLCMYNANAQIETFKYRRALASPTETWHQISIPEAMFSKLRKDYGDIRIVGFTAEGDTIQAPYIIRYGSALMKKELEGLKIINQSTTAEGHYYTFSLESKELINQILLEFDRPNFEKKVSLMGSHSDGEWFLILKDYRILSIQNDNTDYTYSTLHFPPSDYTKYRLFIPGEKSLNLKNAKIALNKTREVTHNNYKIIEQELYLDKKTSRTTIKIKLANEVPVSLLQLNIAEQYAYHRPIQLQVVTDSNLIKEAIVYSYKTVFNGALSSKVEPNFNFVGVRGQQFRLSITNNDNEPLTIDNIQLKGPAYQIIARFTKPATYYLYYGNEENRKPKYDIQLPEEEEIYQNVLSLGEEKVFKQAPKTETKEPVINITLLWAVMGLIIGVLLWFAFKMLGKN